MSETLPESVTGLSSLGLDLDAERIYRHILATRGGTAHAIAQALRLPLGPVGRSLQLMVELGLLRTAHTDVPAYVAGCGVQPSGEHEVSYVPEPPNRTLGRLFQSQASRLIQAGVAVEQLAQLYLAAREREQDGHPPLRVVQGTEQVNEAIHDLITATGSQLLQLDRQPYVRASEPRALGEAMFELLGRGVELRTVYAADAHRVDGYATYLAQAAELGEQARVIGHLPLRYLVSDGSCAVLPLAAQGPWVTAALFLYDSLFVADLVQGFEEVWQRATPLALGPTRREDSPFTPAEVTLLLMLAGDLTEAAIGRQLGTSARTIGRRLAVLQRKLGAHTRFAMGAEAARRGLL